MELVNYVRSKVAALRNIGKDEKGVTALEYGLVATFVAIALVTALSTMGSGLGTYFNNIGSKVSAIAVSTPTP